MIDAMPRPRPPYLQRQVTRHGKTVWYVRVGRGPRTRIRAEFGTPDFDAEYKAAISGTPRPKKGAPPAGSLAWLIERYRETGDWTDLSLATRRNRENHFKQVIKTAGDKPYRAITQAESLQAKTVALIRQRKPAITSTPCVASSGGQSRRSMCRLTLSMASKIRNLIEAPASQFGRKPT